MGACIEKQGGSVTSSKGWFFGGMLNARSGNRNFNLDPFPVSPPLLLPPKVNSHKQRFFSFRNVPPFTILEIEEQSKKPFHMVNQRKSFSCFSIVSEALGSPASREASNFFFSFHFYVKRKSENYLKNKCLCDEINVELQE